MSSIISEQSLQKLEGVKKYLLKGAIWLLVGSVVAGILVILFGSVSENDLIGRFAGTLLIVALMMMICVNNFRRLESREAVIQSFALVGLVSNVLWAVLWTIVVWTISGAWKGSETLVKFASVFSYLSALGFIGSNVMSMYEGDKRDLIRPLKITAVSCATYEMLYLTVVAFTDYNFQSEFAARLSMLAGFVGVVWFLLVIAAWVLSRNEKKKIKDNVVQQPIEKKSEPQEVVKPAENKSDEQLRAEIEEQVRREMIEKEVRARMEAEMGKKEGEQ